MSVYLDHAATTPLDPSVLEAMMPYLTSEYGNASSVHRLGRTARFAIEDARQQFAHLIGAEEGEVVFTSGATESNNFALKGTLKPGDHFITSLAEHEAILEPAKHLQKQGVEVTFLKPYPNGTVSAEQVENALQVNTRLVSVMYVNNELGTVSPIPQIAEICRKNGILCHTDAVQAALFRPRMDILDVDMCSFSAHKVYGPKGVGALYIRAGTPVQTTLIEGGAQERRRRGGTEAVAQVIGLVTAFEQTITKAEEHLLYLETIKAHLINQLEVYLGGRYIWNTPQDGTPTSPHILNLSFPPVNDEPIDGEMLLLNMDMAGFMVSSGSACTSGAVEPSHVLQAMGVPEKTAAATIRFSLGKHTTPTHIEAAVLALARILDRMGRKTNG
ncbi:MAG TPA: cysteine desulfurase NifS [Bacteroidetes bacterium]|nr:cysteine desulfurase NifS [Bacteroidota bacterium]HRR09472.1 cysteine desulfurase family protein [Rhodothermales bacterium]